MTPASAKPAPATPSPESERRPPPARLAPPVSASQRRADLEAQKRYMDDRFGRDRPLSRKHGV